MPCRRHQQTFLKSGAREQRTLRRVRIPAWMEEVLLSSPSSAAFQKNEPWVWIGRTLARAVEREGNAAYELGLLGKGTNVGVSVPGIEMSVKVLHSKPESARRKEGKSAKGITITLMGPYTLLKLRRMGRTMLHARRVRTRFLPVLPGLTCDLRRG